MGRVIPSQQRCRVTCGKIVVWSLRTADALVAVPALLQAKCPVLSMLLCNSVLSLFLIVLLQLDSITV